MKVQLCPHTEKLGYGLETCLRESVIALSRGFHTPLVCLLVSRSEKVDLSASRATFCLCLLCDGLPFGNLALWLGHHLVHPLQGHKVQQGHCPNAFSGQCSAPAWGSVPPHQCLAMELWPTCYTRFQPRDPITSNPGQFSPHPCCCFPVFLPTNPLCLLSPASGFIMGACSTHCGYFTLF